MRVINNGGAGVITAHEYPIAAGTEIKRGAAVKLNAGLVAKAANTDKILGIAAENHPGVNDALNPRADGTTILVHDNPGIIVEAAAPTFTASGGSAASGSTNGTLTVADAELAGSANAFNGGCVKLVKEAVGSAFGAKGCVKKISGFAAGSGSKTITIAELDIGAAAAGDVFALFPPIGAVTGVMSLNTDATGIVCTGVAATKFTVVGHDTERNMVLLAPADMVRDPA